MIKIIDEQCFAGGLTLGVMQAFDGTAELVAKKELQGAFGTANMLANRHLLPGPWEAQDADYTQWEVHDADVIISNPPCSGFSLLSSKAFRGPDSTINACMWGGIEYAAKVKPDIFVMESVQGAYTSGHELMVSLRARLEEKSGLKYDLTHLLHSARSCGSSQMRRRYFFVAHRIPFGIEPLIPVSPLPNTRDCIGDLESLTLQWEPQGYKDGPIHEFGKRARYGVSTVDGHMDVQCLGNDRLKSMVEEVGWGEGEDMQFVLKRLYEKDQEKLPSNILRRLDHYVKTDFATGWNSPGRLRSWHTTPVMTGSALTAQLHYNQPRTLTHREVARFMGFPDNWKIEPLQTYKALPATWGKGVTVNAGRWLGEWLRAAMEGDPGQMAPEQIGDREYLYNETAAWKRAV